MKSHRAAVDRPSLALRCAGVAAVVAGLINAVSDYLLRGGPTPVSGAEISLEALGAVPFDLIFAGSLLGAAVLPLWLAGLWPVYEGLRPAGVWPAAILVLLFGYGIVIASGYHGAYVLYGTGYWLGSMDEAGGIAGEAIERMLAHHDALMALMVPPWVLASVGFTLVVLLRRTHFPRWMSFASPILVPLTMPLVGALPAPFGGYLRPAAGSAIWTLFFLLATITTWNLPPGLSATSGAHGPTRGRLPES